MYLLLCSVDASKHTFGSFLFYCFWAILDGAQELFLVLLSDVPGGLGGRYYMGCRGLTWVSWVGLVQGLLPFSMVFNVPNTSDFYRINSAILPMGD